MTLSTLDYTFWLTGFVGQLLLLTALIWKRRISHFPFFSALIVFCILRTVFLYCVHRYASSEYFYAYWSLTFVDTLLQIGIFFELARKVFRPGGTWSSDVRRPLLCLAAVSVIVAIFLAYLSHTPAKFLSQRIVLKSQLFSTMLIAEIFAGLTLISATSGFVWRSQTGMIARGLGVFSVCALLIQGCQVLVGLEGRAPLFHDLSRVHVLCYLVCLFWWIAGSLRDAPITRPLPEGVRVQLTRLDAYIEAALAQLGSTGAAS